MQPRNENCRRRRKQEVEILIVENPNETPQLESRAVSD